MNKQLQIIIELIQLFIYKRIIFKRVNSIVWEQIENKRFYNNDEVLEIIINELKLIIYGD